MKENAKNLSFQVLDEWIRGKKGEDWDMSEKPKSPKPIYVIYEHLHIV